MKTVPLRELLRKPLKIKAWTRAGEAVQVNDNGRPLWVITPAEVQPETEQARLQAIKEMFGEIDSEPISAVSLSKIIKDSRG